MDNLVPVATSAGGPIPAAAPNVGDCLRYREDSGPGHSLYQSPGAFHHFLTTLGRVLRRGILGKSDRNYMKQFTGSDGYWDRAIAAQNGWPRGQERHPDPDGNSGDVEPCGETRMRG